MLTIRRKEGERIWITGDIWITVLGIKSGSVSLGIDAKPEIEVLREELLPSNRVSEEKKS